MDMNENQPVKQAATADDFPDKSPGLASKPQKGKGSKWQLLRAKRAAARFLLSAKKPGRRLDNFFCKGSSEPLVLSPNIGFIPAWRALSGMLHQNCLWIFDCNEECQEREGDAHTSSVTTHSGMRFVTCGASGTFGAAATVEGEIYTWGDINYGQCPLWSPPHDPNIPINRYSDTQAPCPLPLTPANSSPRSCDGGPDEEDTNHHQGLYRLPGKYFVRLISCGLRHIIGALHGNGAIAWGDNRCGQLGIPGVQLECICRSTNWEPRGHLGSLGQSAMVMQATEWAPFLQDVTTGYCLTSLGIQMSPNPMAVPGLCSCEVVDLSAGSFHNLALEKGGITWSWGLGQHGRLGHDDELSCPVPTLIDSLKYVFVAKVAAGCAHSLALTTDGRVYGWGYGGNGALGLGNRKNQPLPSQVTTSPCCSIAAAAVSMAITKNGELHVWGESEWIYPANEGTRDVTAPTILPWLHGHQIADVACSIEHAVAVTSEGSLISWGNPRRLPKDGKEFLPCAAGHHDQHTATSMTSDDEAHEQSVTSISVDCSATSESSIHDCEIGCREYGDLGFQTIQGLHCSEASLLVLCEESIYEPTREVLDDVLLSVFEAYIRSTHSRSSAKAVEGVEVSPCLEITLSGVLLFLRETGVIDNLLCQSEIIVEFYKLSMERRVSTACLPAPAEVDSSKAGSKPGRCCMGFSDFVKLVERCMARRSPSTQGDKGQCIKTFCKFHLPKLEHRPKDGLRWILQEALTPALLQEVDSQKHTQLLHQCFLYMASGSDREPHELRTPLEEIRRHLHESPNGYFVQIDALVWFLHEAGLFPTNLLQIVGEKQLELENDPGSASDLLQELPSWWFNSGIGKSDSLQTQNEELTARGQLLKVKILSDYLATIYRGYPGLKMIPDADKPGKNFPAVSYPEFVEVIGICVIMGLLNLRDEAPPCITLGEGELQHVGSLMEKLMRWRERNLQPWRYLSRQRTEDELQAEVDRIFSLYCSLDPMSTTTGVSKDGFRRFAKECRIVDPRLPIRKVDSVFEACLMDINGAEANGDDPELAARALGIGIFFGGSKVEGGGRSHVEPLSNPKPTTDPKTKDTTHGVASLWKPQTGPGFKSRQGQLSPSNSQIDPSNERSSSRKREKRIGLQHPGGSVFSVTRAKMVAQQLKQEKPGGTHLTRELYDQALRQLALLKFPKADTPEDAWRHLVEAHLVPVAARRTGKLDEYLQILTTPDVKQLLEQWEASLKHTFRVYSRLDGAMGYATSTTSQEILEQANNTMSFPEFLYLCGEKNVLPHLVNKREIEEIFRRMNCHVGERDKDEIQDMNYAGYIDSFCLVALVAYSKPRFNRELSQATEKIEALLKYCGFKKNMGSRPVIQEAAVTTDADPNQELRALSFTGGIPVRDYSLSLIPECVIPPDNCPQRVGALLEQAFDNHNDSNFQYALDLYEMAQLVWLDHMPNSESRQPPQLPLEEQLYFVVAMGSVLQSDGQDRKALDLYVSFEKQNEEALTNYPNADILQSCMGFVHYRQGSFVEAFQRYLKAKMMREAAPHLGSKHVDTALVYHNIGCTLDRLGEGRKGVVLVSQAFSIFLTVLGENHPRTILADRSLWRMENSRLQDVKPSCNKHHKRNKHKSGQDGCCAATSKGQICRCRGELASGVQRAPCDIQSQYAAMKPDIKSHMLGRNKKVDFTEALSSFKFKPKTNDSKSRSWLQRNKSQQPLPKPMKHST